MGLISFFKNKIYDSRLQKAGKLLEEGRKEEALQIYQNLLGKHPQAAGILAHLYFDDCRKSSPSKQIELLKTIVGLPALNGQELIWDRTEYDDTLAKVVSYLYSDSKKHMADRRFKDAYTLLTGIIEQGQSSPVMLTSYLDACEECLKSHESISIHRLKAVIEKLNGPLSIFNAYDRFIPYVKEYSPEYIKSNSWYILNSGCSHKEAVEKFERCWLLARPNDSEKVSYLKGLFDASKLELARELFSHIVSHPEQYLSDKRTHEILIRWASSLTSFDECLSSLSHLHSVGVTVQTPYEERVHASIGNIDLKVRREILNKALALFPASSSLLNDKHENAKNLAKAKLYSDALETCDELIGKHEQASLTKAKVYVCIASDETDSDKKMESLSLAQNLLKAGGGTKSELEKVSGKICDISLDAAQSYYSAGNKTRAYEIVRGTKTVRAAMVLASFLAQDAADVAEDNKIQYYRDSIDELKATNIKEVLESEEYVRIWTSLADSLIGSSFKADHSSAIAILKNLIEELENEGRAINAAGKYSAAIEMAKKEQIKRMYLLAREQEKTGKIEQAASLYRETKKIEGKSSIKLADLRYVICMLKTGDNNVSIQNGAKIESLLEKSPSAFIEERNEIAYRYALQLLRAGKTDNSLSIVNQYLPQESTLKQACEQQFIIDGLNRLDEFNSKLEQIRTRQLSSNDAIYMVNHMLEFADEVKYVINISRPTLSKYRKSIKNYAVLKLFDEGRYDVAFDKLKKEHSNFLEDLTSLRNIAIVCLNMAESGMINDDNYEEVISIWLTSIYQERLFIKSLDYTSWDDPYTFSLADAYGHFDEDSVGDLPDNVNFDEPDGSTTNVAIKDVQQSLLNRFEASINDNNQYLQFFNEQKEAMDDLLELNLDEKCRIVAPFFAEESEDIFSEIESAFETDRINHYANYEDVLATGYKFGLTDDEYGDYHEASEYYDECVRVLDVMGLQSIKTAYSRTKINSIKVFPKKWDSLVSMVKGKVGSLGSADKSKFDLNYNCYLVICSALRDGTVSFPFANYVMQHIVAEVNGHRISKAKASEYILAVFLLDSSNPRVQENLTTLFEMLVRENSTESKTAVSKILNDVQRKDSSFYNKLNQEYQEAIVDNELNVIVDKVNGNTMKKSAAIERVYQLYTSYSNNPRLCENLAILSNLCIIEYVIGMAPGYQSVQRILDNLKANRSPEFRRHYKVFKDSYNQIWDSLPFDTQQLLDDSSPFARIDPTRTLNEKGYALKRGLGYLKALGGFSTGRFGSLRFDTDDLPF